MILFVNNNSVGVPKLDLSSIKEHLTTIKTMIFEYFVNFWGVLNSYILLILALLAIFWIITLFITITHIKNFPDKVSNLSSRDSDEREKIIKEINKIILLNRIVALMFSIIVGIYFIPLKINIPIASVFPFWLNFAFIIISWFALLIIPIKLFVPLITFIYDYITKIFKETFNKLFNETFDRIANNRVRNLDGIVGFLYRNTPFIDDRVAREIESQRINHYSIEYRKAYDSIVLPIRDFIDTIIRQNVWIFMIMICIIYAINIILIFI
jgi:hypothetical protein